MTTTSEKPRFRTDLVAQYVEEAGIQYVDVTDPNSGSTFRFYDVEYLIASAMNGARDLETLADWTKAELGIDTSAGELANVVSTLADLGYLDASGGAGEDLELGAPGAGQAAAQADEGPDTSGLELGAAGAGDGASEFVDTPTVNPASLELGAPGVGDVAPAADDKIDTSGLELGAAVQAAPVEAAIELSGSEVEMEVDGGGAPPPTPTDAAGARPAPGTADDMSFEGLMEPSKVSPMPAGVAGAPSVPSAADLTPPPADMPTEPLSLRKTTAALGGGMEEDTNLPKPVPEPDDEDVSVDLSQHLSLDKDQVQEAVRQSKVMSVPELPADIDEDVRKEMAANAVAVAEAEAEAGKKMPLPAPPNTQQLNALADSAIASKPSSSSASSSSSSAGRPAVPPVSAIEPTKTPPAASTAGKSGGSSAIIWVLLLLVAAGGGAYWYFFLREPASTGTPAPSSKQGGGPGKPAGNDGKGGAGKATPPKPAAAPLAKLEERAPAPAEAKSPSDGVVFWVETRPEVVVDAPVAKLQGFQRWETQQKQASKRLEVYTAALEKAKTANDAAGIANAEKKVAEKKALVDEAEAELAKLVVGAPAAGNLEIKVKVGTKVAAGDVVATVSGGGPNLVAEFTVAQGADAYGSAEANCAVAQKGAPDKRAACVVEGVEGGKVTVRLVEGSPFAAGDEVELQPAKK